MERVLIMKRIALVGILLIFIGIDFTNAQRRGIQPDWYANPPANTEDTTYVRSIGSTVFEALGSAFYSLANRNNSIESDEIVIDDSYGSFAIFDIEGPHAVIKKKMAVNFLNFSLNGTEDYIIISDGPNSFVNEVLINCYDFNFETEEESINLSRCTEAEVYNHPDLMSNDNYSGTQSWNYNSNSALLDYISSQNAIHVRFQYTTYNGTARYYMLVKIANELIAYPQLSDF